MPEKDYRTLYVQERKTVQPFRLARTVVDLPFRAEAFARLFDHLAARRSTLVVGPTGCGKTALIQAVAARRRDRAEGDIVRMSTMDLMVGTHYLGDWQSKLRAWVEETRSRHEVLYVTDPWNLPTVGASDASTDNVLDALRPMVESGETFILAELSPEQYRTMERIPGFTRLFQRVDLDALDASQVDAVLLQAASLAEFPLDDAARRALLQLSSRFLPAQCQPGPSLRLFEKLVESHDVTSKGPPTPASIEGFFADTTGLPPFIVSRSVTRAPGDIRAWFAERLVGQRAAIESVVESIALFKAGLHNPLRPIATFLFVGPTGVGKTELGRRLAEFVFGSPDRLLRFDLAEFKDYHSFELLLGDRRRPEQPARLLDPVRAQPFQVVLLDELEKAHPNVWDLLLPLLDEGRLSGPGGESVDFRSTIIIATSNIGAAEGDRHAVGFGGRAGNEREKRTRAALEQSFRPEFLNRFQHVVVFHPLSAVELRMVARMELAKVLRRQGITDQSLVVDVADEVLDAVIRQDLDVRYGARALERELQKRVVVPLALALMEREVTPGSILRIDLREGTVRVRTVETERSRAHRESLTPARTPDGRTLDRGTMVERLQSSCGELDRLCVALGYVALGRERERLLGQRELPGFWRDTASAAENDAMLEWVSTTLDRVDALDERVTAVREALERGSSRRDLEAAGHELHALDEALREARREIVVLGVPGRFDAVIECRPVGGSGAEARDLLAEVYASWARHREFAVEWLRVPAADDEPWALAVRGAYAFGTLRGEGGIHRVRVPTRDGEGGAGRLVVAAVRVGPLGAARVAVQKLGESSRKGVERYGCRVRARVEFTDPNNPMGQLLILSNDRTVKENEARAGEVFYALRAAGECPDAVVRRYDQRPPLVRDAATGWSSGRPDALSPRSFDALLRRRIDALALDDEG